MRSPTNNHSSSHEINEFNINNSLMDYSISNLQETIIHQQKQIEQNQELLFQREQHLKYLNQQQTIHEQQERKNFHLKTLQNQINQQKTSNSTNENQLEILKQIFLNKEHELTISLTKLDELTKQLDQLRKLKIFTNNEQSQNKNQLDKLKQELFIRNNLNEQQNRKITYQKEIYATKQIELKQLNQRINELQQNLKTKQTKNDFRTALNTVQDTLNNINIVEIEKHMLQLANSFNNSKKINNSSSKIAFASKNEIAATYMAQSSIKSEEQLLPPKLRLNDDKLSVHFNNVTSNIKKRHSLSDPNDLLIKYLIPNIEQQPIQVRDDSLINTKSIEYDNSSNIEKDNNNEEQTIMESFISDTESEGSLSDDIESIISFSIIPITNLKSLLKTSITPKNTSRRVVFDPLALLLDAAVLGELDLLIKSAKQVTNPSQPNDEGLTALHNAVCASNFECVKFLVEFGCDINYADNDGWTPLHCAASCNNILLVKYLIEHGACIYATTIRDNETAAEKCEEEEDNYIYCSEYLLKIQNDLGVINNGLVYALYDYDPDVTADNELQFKDGDQLNIIRRGDEYENEWYWAKHENTKKEGYIPRNYLGLYPRVRPDTISLTNS